MRTVVFFGVLLVALPLVVLLAQLHRAEDGIGAPTDYLEIEQPPEIDLDDPRLERPGIPVLCYHYLAPRPGPLHVLRVIGAVVLNLPTLGEKHFWSLPVDVFESHLRWLQDEGYETVSADELLEIMQGRRPRPPKAVCITFDDGERSILDLGVPLLRRYDMKATLFVVTSKVGQSWRGLEMLGWEELRELQASGHVSLESHTHDMHYKVKTPGGGMEPVHLYWASADPDPAALDRVIEDLSTSRFVLGERLGRHSRLLAWPYGFASSSLDSVAQRAGFAATFSLAAGAVRPELDSPWHLRRFTITARTTVKALSRFVEAPEEPVPAR